MGHMPLWQKQLRKKIAFKGIYSHVHYHWMHMGMRVQQERERIDFCKTWFKVGKLNKICSEPY